LVDTYDEHWDAITELRAKNPTQFTLRICLLSFLIASLGSWFDGASIVFGIMGFALAVPAIIASKTYDKMVDTISPHVEKLMNDGPIKMGQVVPEAASDSKEDNDGGDEGKVINVEKKSATNAQKRDSKKTK